ncbi:hypothetical protein QBC44DRAFT_372200 [Cladorrhinum sp. PSN332]|nr:hypothetical protein QBC44DRAFT_372200 [Cladorrhinum sp. PSN332]
MVDPVSLLGAVGSVAGIVDVLTRAVGLISELRDQYKDADLMFDSLRCQLLILRAGLTKVGEWAETSPQNTHHQLTVDLDSVIDCCRNLADRVDGQPEGLGQSGRHLKAKMIERQTTTLTLLLTACNSKSLFEQRELLEQPETRMAVALVKDDSSSLVAQFDKTSSIRTGRTVETDRMPNISKTFPFDPKLLKSKSLWQCFAVRNVGAFLAWRETAVGAG